MSARPRASIWFQTIVVLALYGTAVWLIHDRLLAPRFDSLVLSVVLAFTVVQFTVIALVLGVLFAAKIAQGIREARIRRFEPAVRTALVDFVTGTDPDRVERDRAEVLACHARSPEAVERCVVEMLASISGSELERLGDVIDELGLDDRWRARYGSGAAETRREVVSRLALLPGERGNGTLHRALEDPEPAVRIEAARGLLQSRGIGDIERIFQFATEEPLLVRAVLVEDLRPHATRLAELAIPRALAAGRPRTAMVALEMVEAWQKSLPALGVAPLLHHPRPRLRARAIRVLPYASADVDVEREVLDGLTDAHAEVRIAAARVAGRLGMTAAAPALERLLHSRDPMVAVAAAYALADLGETGAEALEAAVRENHSAGAAAALEALERVRTDRLHLARV